ncbi:MAG: hypothetical protein CVV18_06480 [Gammaproteobacteria bacterium HGW-Gammaproteobacteria-8]|nr:MAG: hypothetical protein CVV18_06480 [Gammaproteobacteria bacterium HGW-Gammaproteobacteria-8]
MELLPGGTLEDWLQPEQYDRLTIDDILEIMVQIARALDYAHANGVIHRDIKPANIHYDAVAWQIKIMDFGIAAIGSGKASSLDDDKISGTPSHMAPELLLGHAADARSDLYSLGVVLYQLLSGKLPFSGKDCASVLRQAAAHDILPLQPTRPDTPRELTDLGYRLMALEPSSRPANARQVVDELEEIIDGRRRGILRNVRRQSRAWRGPTLIGSMVALIMAVGMSHIHSSQRQAMADASYGFGDALISLVAQETAEALILEDTTALAVLVSDFAANPEVVHLHISDSDGLIQASTNPYLKGEALTRPIGQQVARPNSGIQLYRTESGQLEFSVPVRFQARRVGEVRLALDGSGLERTARATLTMLALVFGAAMLAVLAGLAWIIRRHQVGLRRLAWGLKRLQRGQYDFRFDDEMRDEFSSAMREFNRLALQLEEQRRAASKFIAAQPHIHTGDWQPGDQNAALDSALDATLDLARANPSGADETSTGKTDDDSRVTPLRKHRPG